MDTIISDAKNIADKNIADKNNVSQLKALNGAEYNQHWLELLCSQITGAYAALLALKSTELDIYQPAAVWPPSLPDAELFSDLVEQVITQDTGLITVLDERRIVNPQPQNDQNSRLTSYALAYPISIDRENVGVVVLAVTLADERHLKSVMNQLQWSSSWIELAGLQEQLRQSKGLRHNLEGAVNILAKVLPEPDFDRAAIRLITELADLQHCNLVAIGLVRKGSVQLCHLSFSAEFSRKMNLVRAIEAAMDEAVDQRCLVQFPVQEKSSTVTLAHRALSEIQGGEALLTVPLFSGETCVGAVTLLRDYERPFADDDAHYCESILALSAATLEEKRQNSRALWRKALIAAQEQLQRLLGKGYPGRKLFIFMTAIVIGLLATVNGDYRLAATAELETAQKRIIVAPYDGYIREAPVRAGDLVSEGQLLVQLDDRDLRLEQLRWQSQKTQLQRQYQDAIARHDRSSINIIAARIDQSDAQLQLVDVQLERAQQKTQIAGRVIAGDLSQRLGGAVTKGEALFEMAPRNAYRISLKVPENRISDVQLGQTGSLHLSALPEQVFLFEVSRMTPVTVSEDGASYFTVEAQLQDFDGTLLQPGMEGVGKIDIDQRLLISIWTRELLEWLRLKTWMWLG